MTLLLAMEACALEFDVPEGHFVATAVCLVAAQLPNPSFLNFPVVTHKVAET